ncbi:hypothetical protein JZX87_01685 [Agrobacterium sp. Ap1]|uniref:hypothetical protein n=1 Tax=Agrobacterium sp. Ap1 TaxID=2815337 RepID=UPI001A8FDD9E|nr:hypothetical protein [Agrobacterium sp. Ap1]MBO0139874.1 hypothetical protein [Agrobacterium sp. Ap1]
MLENWISALQLGAALSFVLGAHASYRQPREAKLEKWADEAVQQIAELRKRDGEISARMVPEGTLLNTVKWKNMSTTDLNDYRRDVTIRYHNKISQYKDRDRRRQALLWINGVFSVIGLIIASAIPNTPISNIGVGAVATALIVIPIVCMLSVWIEEMALHREASPSNRSAAKEQGRSPKIRSTATRGQMFHVFAEIRRRERAGRLENEE